LLIVFFPIVYTAYYLFKSPKFSYLGEFFPLKILTEVAVFKLLKASLVSLKDLASLLSSLCDYQGFNLLEIIFAPEPSAKVKEVFCVSKTFKSRTPVGHFFSWLLAK